MYETITVPQAPTRWFPANRSGVSFAAVSKTAARDTIARNGERVNIRIAQPELLESWADQVRQLLNCHARIEPDIIRYLELKELGAFCDFMRTICCPVTADDVTLTDTEKQGMQGELSYALYLLFLGKGESLTLQIDTVQLSNELNVAADDIAFVASLLHGQYDFCIVDESECRVQFTRTV